MRPTGPSIVGAAFFELGNRRSGRVVRLVGNAFFQGVLLGLVLFEYYAYAEQFDEFGANATLWVALVLSILFILYGYVVAMTRPESIRS